jgi:hypothetical protein
MRVSDNKSDATPLRPGFERRSHLARIVLLLIALAMIAPTTAALLADTEPAAQANSGTSPAKPPWLWTIEERIGERVSPAARETRRGRALRQGSRFASEFAPVDGSREPELFLPVELVTRLALSTGAGRERSRELYRREMVSHGWEFDRFWVELHSAAAPYLSLMEQSGVLQRESRGRADLGHLKPAICAISADLLNTAYEMFGRQEFDEFLYRSVAPGIHMWTADHADTAEALREKDRGCR